MHKFLRFMLASCRLCVVFNCVADAALCIIHIFRRINLLEKTEKSEFICIAFAAIGKVFNCYLNDEEF